MGYERLISHLLYLTEFLLDQIQDEQQPVLPDEVLTPAKMNEFPHHWFLAEGRSSCSLPASYNF